MFERPAARWLSRARLSARVHVVYTDRAYDRVLSCAPPMDDELWVAGKCVYKLEPIVADDGELIVYAPHLSRISTTHGDRIRELAYHVRDYCDFESTSAAGECGFGAKRVGVNVQPAGDAFQVELATQDEHAAKALVSQMQCYMAR